MANVEWLLREATDERPLRVGERTVVDDARWRATIERLQLGPGLRIFLTEAEARRDITVEARDDRTDRWMGSQVTIAGRADIDFLDGARTYASSDRALGCCLVQSGLCGFACPEQRQGRENVKHDKRTARISRADLEKKSDECKQEPCGEPANQYLAQL